MPKVIEAGMERVDAPDKARGTAMYAGDYADENMLHACLVRAEHAHARIVNIDTSALPEKAYCFTAKDLACNVIPFIFDDQPAFADEKVRFYGEPIAVVAAGSYEEALAAAKTVTVTYEELPPVLDAEAALQEGAAFVHAQGNTCGEFHRGKGDPDAAFES